MWFSGEWFSREWSSGEWFSNGPIATTCLLIVAALLDFAVGDPWSWPHPVQFMGKVIALYSRLALSKKRARWLMKLLGVGLAILLIGGSGLLSWIGLRWLAQVSPGLSWLAQAILLASCFAGRSLRRAANEVLAPLKVGDLTGARSKLAMYVGRDTEELSAEEIYRAILETASENAVDGVFAPLFYAVLGAVLGAILGVISSAIFSETLDMASGLALNSGSAVSLAVPMALAYKAASTLDSMVGYREAPYTDLGWFSARLEDRLTWLPCRMSVLAIALLSGKPRQVLRLCRRDAPADPSPNAGWSECAYAAALGVRLGGANSYQGSVKVKPFLGEADRPITESAIAAAYQLTRRIFLLGLSAGVVSLWLLYYFSVSLSF